MKNMHRTKMAVAALLMYLSISTSCSKLLDEKPDRAITTISKFEDLVAILRSYEQINNFGISPSDVGSDEYLLSSSAYANLEINHQGAYKWDKNAKLDGWSTLYRTVYYANLVLQELDNIQGGSAAERENIKGQALFFRSFAFYQLAQFYCRPYSESAQVDPGLPLRLSPNVEEKIARSTVKETYDQIIKDAQDGLTLMPMDNGAINIPDKLSCFGFLSRVYLSMRDYVNAEKYASLYLEASPSLIDFNKLDTLSNPAIQMNNAESAFISYYAGYIPGPSTPINPDLIGMYAPDDLRRKIFFTTTHDGITTFKGSYEGIYGFTAYCGVATDEIYLNRAECLVRLNRIDEGLADLDTLLSKRWMEGTYTPASATSETEALDIILKERRKELLFRSLRWTDIRRLNLEGANIGFSRQIDGITYTLPANDKRWVWLIPDDVIKQSGIIQNER